MSPRAFPPRHGRTHLPGGSDPVPFETTGSNGYEMARELLRPADWTNNTGDSTVTFGNYGGTGALMTLCNALNDEAHFAMRLGPQGAMYHLQFICQRAPDAGIFQFAWAQVPGSLDNGDGWPNSPDTGLPDDELDGSGFLYSPRDNETVGLSWQTISDGQTTHDLYADPAVDNSVGNGTSNAKYQQFRIVGAPGDVMTTMAATGGGGHTFGASDGGPGIYLLRVKVTGQNASSSGYNIRLSSLTVQREFYDNFSV